MKRIQNYIQLRTSYLLSKLTGSSVLWGKPYSMSIETSGSCQLHCPECPLGSGENTSRSMMDINIYKKLLDNIQSHCMILSLYYQGEAFLNSEIFNFIKLARAKNLYTIISTNGNIKDKNFAKNVVNSRLSELIFSIDGTTQDSYSNYRKGGNLELVLSNIKDIQKEKIKLKTNTPKLRIQFLIMSHNESEISEIKRLSKSLNIKLRLKTIQLKHPQEQSDLLPKNYKYRRYSIKNGNVKLNNTLKNHCWRLYRNPVITSQGDVLPCCFDKSCTYKMGNIREISFSEIWKNNNYKQFRKNVFSNRKNIDICTNCTEGTKRIYV